MAQRRCPYCGEMVPSNSITCPKCYKKLPNEEPGKATEFVGKAEDSAKKLRRNPKIAIGLDLVLGLVGLLGIGQVYMGRPRFLFVTLIGLLVFVAAVCLTVFIFTIILAVPMWIIYVLMYLGVLADILLSTGSMRMSFGRSV